ncbi:MAG: hypothetical protein CM15mV41_0130 [Caudoviricetes sp.]|nr:MAG: hypothetical protein CM15mV41_0130 [Caudoviricetes sp.]
MSKDGKLVPITKDDQRPQQSAGGEETANGEVRSIRRNIYYIWKI